MIFDARVFPILGMCLNLLATVSYAFEGDWRRAVYWLAAATITLMVTL